MAGESRTELTVQAIVTLLGATGKPSGLGVDRSRRASVDKAAVGTGGLISVYPMGETPALAQDSRTCQLVIRTLDVALVCRARGGDAANDPLRKWAVQQMMKLVQDASLVIQNVKELSTEWEDAEGADPINIALMKFAIEFTTNRSNLANRT